MADVAELLRSVAKREADATTTPPLSAVRRRHRRRRTLQTATAMVGTVAAVSVSVLALQSPRRLPEQRVATPPVASHSAVPSEPPLQRVTVRTSRTESFAFWVPAHWQVLDERECATSLYAVVVADFGWDVSATPPNCPTSPESRIVLQVSEHPPWGTQLSCGGDYVPLYVPKIGATGVSVEVNWPKTGRTCISPGGGWPVNLYFHADSGEGSAAVLDILRSFEPAR